MKKSGLFSSPGSHTLIYLEFGYDPQTNGTHTLIYLEFGYDHQTKWLADRSVVYALLTRCLWLTDSHRKCVSVSGLPVLGSVLVPILLLSVLLGSWSLFLQRVRVVVELLCQILKWWQKRRKVLDCLARFRPWRLHVDPSLCREHLEYVAWPSTYLLATSSF